MGLLPAILPIKAAFGAVSALVRAATPGRGDFAAQLRNSVETRFVSHFDADKNGTVTPDEFPGARGMFGQWDRNGDGAITKDEVHSALNRLSDAAKARAAAQESWDMHDADHNGLLTRAETGLAAKELSALDKDGNGTLDRAEWFATSGVNEGH